MRTYISTIGYHSTRVMRPILNNGIDADDTVVLLRPLEDEKEQSKDAIQDVRQTVRELGPDTTVVTEAIDHDSFETAVLECVDVIEAANGQVILNFDGGPREVFLPFTVAAISRPNLIDQVFQFRDTDQKVRELSLPNLMDRVPEVADETLQAVGELDEEATLPSIAESTGKARSTVGRHLDKLEEANLVRTQKAKKTREVRLTLGGRLRLQ
ncbi:CRISPR-associated CARF protein Csa3 [Haloterrigena alkaliphila]|uniref:CRISPR locus-related DNA-binding protein n=1 Tax=Haloterrigena alkaliphila TaxID=2816475 RepID=A0A8A2VEH6_9EURY|nr:CRISPR-associated CARF protein Csa3 [Haloterrigena alkaliphila]QSX00460.1 CRISPR-associated CARF protein Csa3 [Haloterrigena alkaliphila]